MLLIHFSGAERSLSLTKDAFLYDAVGQQIANYYASGGATAWPGRVSGVIDFGWEHFLGIFYFLVGHVPLLAKLVCVIAGSLVPLVHYRTGLAVVEDKRIAKVILAFSVLFPTQIYYSTLLVRDSIATLAISLVFCGVALFVSRSSIKWWLPTLLGFLMLAGLRSYLCAILVITIPAAMVASSILSATQRSRRARGSFAALLLGVTVLAALYLSPELIGELDTQFTDLDHINKTRVKMNRGGGAFFSSGSVTEVGSGVLETATSIIVGLYFFFFSVNPTSLGSIRQLMALPEVAIVAVGTYHAVRGGRILWRFRRPNMLPVLIPTLVVTAGYSAATTNGGPLMRWRMQLVGVYIVLAATGWVYRKVPWRRVCLDA